MNDIPLLPCFKPIIRLKLLGPNDPYPSKLPFFDDEGIYLHASTSDKDFLNDPLKSKAWKTGNIKSPEFWWLARMNKGFHPNFQKVVALCENNVPEAVAGLYHPVWQLRLGLRQPIEELLYNAKFQWSSFWYEKTGRYKLTTVNYVN